MFICIAKELIQLYKFYDIDMFNWQLLVNLLKPMRILRWWGGVMKDGEASFIPNYVHLKNFWGLMLLLVFFINKSRGI